MRVCVCVCVCSQASRSRATLSCDSSYFSYWQSTIQASYAVMRQLLFVNGVTQDNNLCLGNLKSAVDTDHLFPKCVLYDYNYIEQISP